MTRLLIVESNTAELIDLARARRWRLGSEMFASAFRQWLPEVRVEVIYPYINNEGIDDIDAFDGVVFTGSSVDWSTDAPQAEPLRRLMERTFAAELPTYGSCNGLQLAAVVLGGAVTYSPNGFELGLAQVQRLDDGSGVSPLTHGRASHFSVCTIHRDEVSQLPEQARCVATNEHSAVQAFTFQSGTVNFWGTQYHPEYCPSDMSQRLNLGEGLFESTGDLGARLAKAETDERSAASLGTTCEELAHPTRSIELKNWLVHIGALSTVQHGSVA